MNSKLVFLSDVNECNPACVCEKPKHDHNSSWMRSKLSQHARELHMQLQQWIPSSLRWKKMSG